MTNDFRDEFRRALAGELGAREQPLQAALDRFVAWANEDFGEYARFTVERGAHPNLRHVVVRPRGRRNETSTLLVFYLDSASARVMGSETFLVGDADGLRQYLLAYIREHHFEGVVEMLKRRAAEPVEGIIRTTNPLGRDPRTDVFAVVAPEHFFPFADQIEEGGSAAGVLPAEAIQKQGIGHGAVAAVEATWLVAGGYGLHGSVAVLGASDAGTEIRLTVTTGTTLDALRRQAP